MSEGLVFFLMFVAVILICFDLWAIVSVFRSDAGTDAKFVWAFLIAMVPVVGLILWGISGPQGVARGGPTSKEHSKG
ncbi:PLD nuclease N-terminal domain-containing protein [Pseudomonas indica]|uniref:Phospholipase_D-nuclease N-terminal n=1 Tax=Pseudomonas indica TaxID=137658 RepID=A0A1G8W7G5_9PSED|nr:PLD nuclease N-terminal domain-containing protein [Pseudomonas indica]MBU3055987.1 PLD nuclease N-terminal domain-containing protein [Pseudomonas indica]PAU58642.1 hypothetical protein BZL42_12365 [Pseudomonas indica]SDJ74066.1 Phospholipase_D-nuclease N-terminal [Pseudomonas indica]